MLITRVDVGTPELDAVVRLAKSARRTVGFLPDAAFRDRARKGTLLAEVQGGTVRGYVLYDLPRAEVHVVQLVVRSDSRGLGIAEALIEDVVASHPDRRGVWLDCRRDFDANTLWPRLGFDPVSERRGNSRAGSILTRWWRHFGHPDLFSAAADSDLRPRAVLDASVYFDLISPAPKADVSHLADDWLGSAVALSVTNEILVEGNRHSDASVRKESRLRSSSFVVINARAEAWKSVLDEVRSACVDPPPKSDENDLRHIARAAAGGARWLVTTDRGLAARYGPVAESVAGLSLVTPSELLREVDAASRESAYRPSELAGTDVTIREVSAPDVLGLAHRFVNHASGERTKAFRRTVAELAADARGQRLEVVEVDAVARALVAHRSNGERLEVSLARVTEGVGARTIGRHVLAMVRGECTTQGLSTAALTDPTPSKAILESAGDEGFTIRGAELVAHTLRGVGSPRDLSKRLKVLGERLPPPADSRLLRAELERRYAPFKVVRPGLPCFVVPIQHQWATDLFDAGLAEGQLFGRPWKLGLRRELVYYRKPANHGGISAPARILWYVSGDPAKQAGCRTVRAVSLLDEVVVDRADRLFFRYQRLGVYRRDQVEACSDARGKAMALRFSNTELLPRPVPLADLREAISGDRHSRSVVLQSPQPVDEQVFVSLYEGSGAV